MEAVAQEAPKDRSITRGYSLPTSLHERITAESRKRDMSRSDLVRKAVRFYLRSLQLRETDSFAEVE